MTTAWHVGTVGFGYAQWQGVFYPAGLKATDRLGFYAGYFDSVEIDTTFYGTPAPSTVARWAAQTPAGFRFALKAPQQVTHAADVGGSGPELLRFLTALEPLGERLGVILLQFPPRFTFDAFPVLNAFVENLPRAVRFAIEFRDRSWRRRRVLELLRRHDVAWVSADYVHLPAEVHRTASFQYLRFIGRHGAYTTKDREIVDPTARLQTWLERLTPVLPTADHVFGYFNNDYSGYSPRAAVRLKRLIGQSADLPVHPVQPSLF